MSRRGGRQVAAVAVTLFLVIIATGCSDESSKGRPAATTSTVATANEPLDLAAHPSALGEVPAEYRPVFRWWWPSDDLDPDELKAELRAIKGAGFGAVEQVLLRNNKQWGSARYRELIEVAATEADRLGIRFDVTLGPSWPMSSPVTEDLSNELSSQSLHYGSTDLDGPQTFSGAVPDAPTGSPSDQKRLVAVTAYRVLDGDVLDPTSSVDLTSQVVDGTISWSAPEGQWRLFGFWMRPSLMRSKAIGGGEPGWYVVDHLSRDAVEAVLADYDDMLFDDEMTSLLKEHGGDLFEDSYEVEHGPTAAGHTAVLWTPAMLDEFASRRGYSVEQLLAGLFTEIQFPGDLAMRLRRDYQETVTDLTIADHIEPITEWAHEKGLQSRSQPYQAGLGALGTSDNNRLAAAADHADVETLGFGDPTFGEHTPVPFGSADGRAVLDRYRQVVSGSHLAGRSKITNEWGAVMSGQFQVDPSELLTIANRSLSAGVTRMALHGFAYRDYVPPEVADAPRPIWPGWCAWCGRGLEFADAWNETWPQLKALPSMSDYLSRAAAVLENGNPNVDLAILDDTSVVSGIGAPDTSGTPDDVLRSTLGGAAFTWDSVDTESVDQLGDVDGGRLLPDGPGYRALVIDDLAAIPAASIERVLELAKKGLPVVVLGARPEAGTGFHDADAEDADVRAAAEQLLTLPNVRSAASPAALVTALDDLKVSPDMRGGAPTTIVPVHRRTAAGDIWFLFNDSATPITDEVTFATNGAPTEIDLWTGTARPLASSKRANGTVTVPLAIPPGGTVALTFDRKAPSESTVTDEALGASVEIAGPWNIEATTVQPSGDETVETQVPALVDWEQISELRGRSGTATATSTFEVPAEWLAEKRTVLFDPGPFHGALRVWINDKPAPIPLVPDQGLHDVTDLLRTGENAVRLEITSTLRNAMIAQGMTGDPNYAAYAGLAAEPTGLTGPVRLVPYVEAEGPTR